MNGMNRNAGKNALLTAAVTLAVFEGLTLLVQWIDPQGGLLRVDWRNPVQHLIIIAAALGFGACAYYRALKKNKDNE